MLEDDGRLKLEAGDSLTSLSASLSLLSDTTKDYLRYLTAAIAGHQGRERCSARACSTSCGEQSRRSDGGSVGRGGEGDEAPSAEIEVRHRGRNRRSDF